MLPVFKFPYWFTVIPFIAGGVFGVASQRNLNRNKKALLKVINEKGIIQPEFREQYGFPSYKRQVLEQFPYIRTDIKGNLVISAKDPIASLKPKFLMMLRKAGKMAVKKVHLPKFKRKKDRQENDFYLISFDKTFITNSAGLNEVNVLHLVKPFKKGFMLSVFSFYIFFCVFPCAFSFFSISIFLWLWFS